MRRFVPHRFWLSAACLIAALSGTVPIAQAQVGGVYIDPQGMLRETSALGEEQRLQLLRAEAADPPATRDIAARSPLRKVSLRRLEQRVQTLQAAGESLPADVRYLAGLTGVQYVFFYPDAGDVVLAGPAEGWRQLPTGDVVGAMGGRPVLHLDDLAVALRYAFRPRAAAFIGCSIDPTPEGLKNYAQVVRQLRPVNRAQIPQVFAAMERSIGPFAVTVYGVEADTPFALKMVAADYRLKRIALAHDPPPVPELPSYLDLAARRFAPAAAQPQHRWWFVAQYDAIYHTPDGLAFELEGQGVRLDTAQTLLGPDAGDKKKDRKASPAAEQFARLFTQHYARIAQRQPIFAELQNLIALSVAAELIAEKRDRGDNAAHWQPAHLLNETACPVATVTVPELTPPMLNARLVGGRQWLTTLSGGVEIIPRNLVSGEALTDGSRRPLAETHQATALPDDPQRWWWD